MKALFRILIIATALAIVYYYSSDSINEDEPLEGPNSSSPAIPNTVENLQSFDQGLPRPEKGLSTFIGQKSEQVIKQFGEPNRIDKTSFGYEWWVYNKESSQFVMFGVEGEKINQVYAAGTELDVTPYYVGQSLDDIYRMTIVDTEVTATIGDNVYTFNMNEEDMRGRILTKFDGIFAQLYIDNVKGTLSGIRFMNSKTLVYHRPYEMSFVGELISPPNPTSFLLDESNQSSANQLFDLLNVFRLQNEVAPLERHLDLANIAMQHSEDMYSQNYLAHESPKNGSLKERLEMGDIHYKEVHENLASAYLDAIEAAHGWLNSEGHREVMLDEKYTHVGSGVFLNYYTQIMINKEDEVIGNEVPVNENY